MYSAINLRGALRPPKPAASSFFHLCVGYYNVVLPSFLIGSLTDEQTFWLRSASTKRQTTRAVKSPFLGTRALAMSLARERQAIGWARFDDAQAAAAAAAKKEAAAAAAAEKASVVIDRLAEGVDQLKLKVAQAVGGEPTSINGSNGSSGLTDGNGNGNGRGAPAAAGPSEQEQRERAIAEAKAKASRAPQTALMGVSFLGNLDAISNCAFGPTWRARAQARSFSLSSLSWLARRSLARGGGGSDCTRVACSLLSLTPPPASSPLPPPPYLLGPQIRPTPKCTPRT